MPGRTFIALAGAILLMILAGGSVATFGLFFAAEQQAADQDHLDRMFRMADTASRAEITFKEQVQEWKNILLRGGSSEDFTHYLNAFQHDGEQVEGLLKTVLSMVSPEQRGHVESLIAERLRSMSPWTRVIARLWFLPMTDWSPVRRRSSISPCAGWIAPSRPDSALSRRIFANC